MRLDNVLNKIITAAYNEAKSRKHEYFTPEHILYAMMFFDEGRDIIESCGGDPEELKSELGRYMEDHIESTEDVQITESVALQRVIHTAGMHVISSEREVIKLGDVIIAIYDEEDTFASYYIRKQGISKLDILNYIAHGVPMVIRKEKNFEIKRTKEDAEEIRETIEPKEDFLDSFCIELTEKARKGEIDPLIGREDILNRTIQVLCRRTKNNPIHVGEPGVGKTAITEGLAQLIVDNKVPVMLRNCKIYYLDMGAMLAGTKYRGDFEERMKKVLQEIQKQPKAIVYIDEIHTLVGAGSVSGGSMDASNILKPFLSKGKLRVIGSTTYDEYKKHFDKDKALSRRFQKIEVSEPTLEETYKILKGLKINYESFHRVLYMEEALKLASELAAKYIQDRMLPDKAIDVIDEAGAYARLNSFEDKIVNITTKDIERVVALIAKIPEASVSKDEIAKLKELDYLLKNEIFGQDSAIDALVKAIKRNRAGFEEGEKPVASLLFVGPTGVGKTEVARQLAKIFAIPLIRYDMSEYAERHAVARLIGAPPGYVGYEEGGLLTEAIRKSPYCVLLLDEIEKAHSDILNILLQVMDYATLTDNNGKKADFRNVILLMTSNAGAREVGRTLIGFNDRHTDSTNITKEVERIFTPEFRNRLDDIIVFNHLNEDMALRIAAKALEQFKEKLKEKDINLIISDKCFKWLALKGFSSKYGAREILRVMQEKIKSYFVDEVLFGKLSKGGTAVMDIIGDEVKVNVTDDTVIHQLPPPIET
jgi:ATP-dependent Clp protease ATP-binding subunit ClpA